MKGVRITLTPEEVKRIEALNNDCPYTDCRFNKHGGSCTIMSDVEYCRAYNILTQKK